MKKAIAKAMLVCVVAVGLIGCGSSDKNSIVGEWKMETMVMNGAEINLEDIAQAAGEDVSEYSASFTFSDDGKMTIDMAGDVTEAEYTVDGDTVNTTFEGEELAGTIKDDTIVFTDDSDGTTINLKKK